MVDINGEIPVSYPPRQSQADSIKELVESIRLTVEFVGMQLLPPRPGWLWFDMLTKYAPDLAKQFASDYEAYIKESNDE